MSFLYPWVFFVLIPLYLLYKKNKASESKQIKLLYFSLVFLLFTLARPVISDSLEDQKFDVQEYIIALDASFSMQADDIKPSRYEAAKEMIKELINTHPKDKFSLFAFTSNMLLISPPTTDGAISIMALDALNPNFILTKSTELKQLFSTIAKTSSQRKNLILFSDGGDENDLAPLLALCKTNNIVVSVVAMATKEGVALKKDGMTLKDQYSSLVISRLNPILKELSLQSGGNYYEFDTATLSKLSHDISSSNNKKSNAITQLKSYKELYYFPLILSLLLFLAAITKLHQLSFLALILLLPNPSHADLIDFYHFTQRVSSCCKRV